MVSLHPNSRPTALAFPASRAATNGRTTILVVDDDRYIRQMLAMVLEDDDFSVLTAAHGHAALALLREHHAHIAAVVSDVQMPYMDGPTLYRAMQDTPSLATIPVLFVSAAQNAPADLDMDSSLFLSKPIDIGLFLDVVRLWAMPPQERAVGA